MCVCTERGHSLRRLGKNVDKITKGSFGLGRPRRARLGEAEVAYVFVGQTREQYDAELRGDFSSAVVTEVKWFHVSDHSYSPWESTYQAMRCADDLQSSLQAPPSVFATLSLRYFSKFFMLDTFNLQLRWSMAIYLTGGIEDMLSEFIPNMLRLVLEPDSTFQEVWKPWRKKQEKLTKADSCAGWLELLDDKDENTSSSKSDEEEPSASDQEGEELQNPSSNGDDGDSEDCVSEGEMCEVITRSSYSSAEELAELVMAEHDDEEFQGLA